MLINPFTPSMIASLPEDFYGRSAELQTLERALRQGSVVIQGPVGIGKSSLLARTLLHTEGFQSDHKSRHVIIVGNKDISTVDDLARLILEELVDADETKRTLSFGITSALKYESATAYDHFKQGRHFTALSRIVEDAAFKIAIAQAAFFIIAIDECDKIAHTAARLVRSLLTKTQLAGIGNVRFLLSGVSPFFQEMIKEDQGLVRFVYETLNLGPMEHAATIDLLNEKFSKMQTEAEKGGIPINVDETLIERIAALSGGHPHLVQLLGSRTIEHEDKNPDGIIDLEDLVGSLQTICYDSRGQIYETIVHDLKYHDKVEAFLTCLRCAKSGFPTLIPIKKVQSIVDIENLEWLLSKNLIYLDSDENYGLYDEFLRIRIVMDAFEKSERIEAQLINSGRIKSKVRLSDELYGDDD